MWWWALELFVQLAVSVVSKNSCSVLLIVGGILVEMMTDYYTESSDKIVGVFRWSTFMGPWRVRGQGDMGGPGVSTLFQYFVIDLNIHTSHVHSNTVSRENALLYLFSGFILFDFIQGWRIHHVITNVCSDDEGSEKRFLG